MEVVIASSPVDSGIGCWDLRSGAEQLRYRSCASSPHGLLSVARRFLASSQVRDSPAAASASAPIFFWSWDKPQVEVRSFPAEPIGPLVSNSEGTYIIGGGLSGTIYLWEMASGKLLNKWRAHYRTVTCLTLSDDESLLISGSEDGCVRVWSLLMMFDDMGKMSARNLYRYSFSEHALRVTDLVSGYGLCNSIVISSSEDHTCKVWSLSEGKLLRSITFPSIVDAIAMDQGEHAFYAGGRDGKIYIAALNAESNPNSIYGMFIIGSLYDHSKAITCLALSTDGTLVSGSEDGKIRVWDTKSQHVTRILKHAKAPVNNVLIIRQPLRGCPPALANAQASLSRKRLNLSLPPPLSKYIDPTDGDIETKAVNLLLPPWQDPEERKYRSSNIIKKQIKELQQQRSSGAAEMELERLRLECKRSIQMVHQWKKMYQDLQNLCVNELLNGVQLGD
ncbi:protein ROOT INITIATION DEFECTIVE 3 [Cocos nucifera]|uniref:Protein ROOT INITIATION DEFECTIVE 3 n=1 Tax=Cocos nucifera TaxID=13894 RepID=A0A8K0HWR3_COCNU|nr:protein ROOT INITIATION DEFECTIVE 3 [Cocos nucifera]